MQTPRSFSHTEVQPSQASQLPHLNGIKGLLNGATLKLIPLILGLIAKNHISIAVVGAIRRDMTAGIRIQTVVTA
ncbi:hypothetical protein PspR76_13855 [Pseudomonas sp. R76]|nr:hypothetical protein PspR76_13855 [Pseudomonas sp. R76]